MEIYITKSQLGEVFWTTGTLRLGDYRWIRVDVPYEDFKNKDLAIKETKKRYSHLV